MGLCRTETPAFGADSPARGQAGQHRRLGMRFLRLLLLLSPIQAAIWHLAPFRAKKQALIGGKHLTANGKNDIIIKSYKGLIRPEERNLT